MGSSTTPVGIMFHNLAMAEDAIGDEPAAKHAWERSLAALTRSSSEGSLAVIRVNYALSLIRAGELDADRPQVAMALKMRLATRAEKDPDSLKARVAQAMWRLRKGDAAWARAEIARIRPLVPASKSWLGIEVERQAALAEEALGHTAEALQGFLRTEEIERRYYGAGHILCALGRVPRAELLEHGNAAQRAAGATLAAAILRQAEGALVPTAPLLARLKVLAAAARPERASVQAGG